MDYWELQIDYETLGKTLTGESFANLDIPYNDNNGASSEIVFDDNGSVESVEVSVRIAHTYVGDLQLELVSPSGNVTLLQATNGSSDDNLDNFFSVQTTPAFAIYVSEDVSGKCLLRVRDMAKYDVGKLEYWGIAIQIV